MKIFQEISVYRRGLIEMRKLECLVCERKLKRDDFKGGKALKVINRHNRCIYYCSVLCQTNEFYKIIDDFLGGLPRVIK